MNVSSSGILKINGTVVPDPKYEGLTISRNKIWSRNTGRNSLGTMVGTIIAIKNSIEITWPPLTPTETALIDSLVSDISRPYTTIEYLSEAGTMQTITAYFSDVSYPVKSYINGKEVIDGVQISGIQQ